MFDINKIQKILPHRYPFLLIDKVIDYVPDISAHAIKCVTINEPFFQGHFPGRPPSSCQKHIKRAQISDLPR